jgi:hypothetical protein
MERLVERQTFCECGSRNLPILLWEGGREEVKAIDSVISKMLILFDFLIFYENITKKGYLCDNISKKNSDAI